MVQFSRRQTLLLALVASVALLALPAAFSGSVRLTIARTFEPVTATVRAVGRGLRARVRAFGRGSRLQQDLEAERARRISAEQQLAAALEELRGRRRADQENQDLHAVLELAGYRGVPIPANVIRRPGRWESCEIIVDRGSEQGVVRGAAVLIGDAFAGVVGRVWPDSSEVLLLGHPRLAVPALILETRQQGVLESADGRLELKFIPRDQPVRPDYQVVTRQEGPVPRGCLIGNIAAGVAPAQNQPFYKIFVKPARAVANPEVVYILTGVGSPPPEKPAPASGGAGAPDDEPVG